MAYLTETGKWEEGVYQWETQDPVVGGPDGIDNVPTRQLANRTGFLKAQVEAHAAATDPHPQYTTDSEVQSQIAAHTAANDPHPQYTTANEVQAQITDHAAASDPHPQYTTESEVHALVEVTQPQFDSTKKPASTEFVKRSLGNYRGAKAYTATSTLTVDDIGYLVECQTTNAITLTLPAAGSAGSQITIVNINTGTVTVTTPSGTIYYGAGLSEGVASSVTVRVGALYHFVWDGANYILEGTPYTFTAAQFEKSGIIPNTAWVQRALGNRAEIRYVAATVTLDVVDWGKLIPVNCTAASQVITLPFGSLAGTQMQFQNWGSYDVSITAPIGLLITSGGNSATQTLHVGSSCTVTWDGVNFFMAGALVGTPPQFANGYRTANTAFVQQALGNHAGISQYIAAAAMPAADWGRHVILGASAAYTLTLPSFNNVPSGATISFYNYSQYDITISSPSGSNGAFYYSGGATSATFVMSANSWAIITYHGGDLTVRSNLWSGTAALTDNSFRVATTSWVRSAIANIVNGSFLSSLASAAGFAFSASTNGYLKFPSWLGGLMLQWGTTAVILGDYAARFTFPAAFPNACLQVLTTGDRSLIDYNGAGQTGFATYDLTTTGFTCSNDAQASAARFFAIGY